MRWLRGFDSKPPIYLVHGNNKAKSGLADYLNTAHDWPADIARDGQRLDLLAD